MAAWLFHECKLAPDAIGRMTPTQVAAIALHPRKADGSLDLTPAAGTAPDPDAQARRRRWRLGLPNAP
jgi:hypothetical protein